MGHHRADQANRRLKPLAPNPVGALFLGSQGLQFIGQLPNAGNGFVEVKLVQIVGNGGDGLVNHLFD